MIKAADSLLEGCSESLKISFLPLCLRSRITVAGVPHPVLLTPCWLWTGRLNRNGYGRVCIDGKEPVAHRAVFEALVGPIPPRHLLDHQCKMRHCVNPWHTEPVTHRENTIRGDAVLFQSPSVYRCTGEMADG